MQNVCRRTQALLWLLVLMSFAVVASAQNTIHVPADAPTIQQAIFLANNGDEILVSPGTYFELLDFEGKAVRVQSTDGAAVTTIDGGFGNTVVQFINGEGPQTVLRGFTITHGSSFEGGGIRIFNASPGIENNVITANHACEGSGLSADLSSSIIRNNIISNNLGICSPGDGAGVEILDAGNLQLLNNTITGNQLTVGGNGAGVLTNASATPVISGNLIQNNSALNGDSTPTGGGLYIAGAAVITNNVITGNSAALGGGVFTVPDLVAPAFVNNTVSGNSATQGAQLYIDGSDATVELANNLFIDFTGTGAVFCGPSAGQVPVFDHNDIFSVALTGAPSAAYTGVCTDQTGITGNIQSDPQFVIPITGPPDFHLQLSSPALDAGNNSAANVPTSDLDGNIRIAASNTNTCTGIVDMGAYELMAPSTGTGFLSSSSLDFGTAFIGLQPFPTQQLTFFANGGCVQAVVSTVGDFQQANTCGPMLGGNSCTIQVTFNPTAPGLRVGSLLLNLGTEIAPVSATLTGRGQNSGSVSPANLDFGGQLVQTTSPSQIVNVFGNGNSQFQLTGISISGDFANAGSNCFDNGCFINITFTPTSGGLRTGILTVVSNQGTYTVPLSGNGLAPIPSITPSSLVFASQTVGTSSGSQIITLTNSGQTSLFISAVKPSSDFFVQPLTCIFTLDPGVSCTYSVAFSPIATGDRSGTLEIDTNAGTLNVALSGIGTLPLVSLSPQFLNFATQPIGSLGAPQTVTMTNISGGPLQLSSIGASNNFLAVSSCPTILDVNASCTVDVSLAPNTAGPYNGFLSVVDLAGDVVTAVLSGSDAHQTLHVPGDFPSIQSAIFAAQNGDTVLVSPGTYFEQINFQGKAITVASSSGPAVTILDGESGFIPVAMGSNEPPEAVLKGFTITHGSNSGIELFDASPTIEDNVITSNTDCGGIGGAGILLINSAAVIQRNTISNNDASCDSGSSGGGIEVNGSNGLAKVQILNNIITGNVGPGIGGAGIAVEFGGAAVIQNNTIQNNTTAGNGGGILVSNSSTADIVGNVITGNSASAGAGIYEAVDFFAQPLMVNNTIAKNTSGSPGTALFIDGQDSNVAITNNLLIDSTGFGAVACGTSSNLAPLFFNNDVLSLSGAPAYGGICQDATGTNGNIKLDPQFVSPANNDYHLLTSSPAIDSGNAFATTIPDRDLEGNGRPAPGNAQTCLSAIDMGAYEFQLSNSGTVSLPTGLDLPNTPVGASSSFNLIMSASGCLSLSSVQTTGDFQQTNSCSGAVSSFSSCDIQLTFSPTDPGFRTGSLKFNFGKSAPSQSVALTGFAFEGPMFASPSSLGFGSQAIGTSSAAQTVNVFPTNAFGAPLEVNGIWINGDFAQINNCGTSAPAFSGCTFNITFAPTAAGSRTGSLVVTTNQGAVNIALSGDGIPAATATLAPASLAFGNQLVNTTSVTQFLTLTNTSGTSFAPGAITISGDFAVNPSQCGHTGLAPGASCVYAISFKPAAIGTRTGLFTVQTPSGTLSSSLSGVGVAPVASISPLSLTFAAQVLNTTSAAQAITVTNTGTATLVISGVSITGNFAQTNTCAAAVPPGGNCTINVTFTPTSLGTQSGQVSVVSNAGNFVVPVSGTGLNAAATLSPASLAFGTELIGSSSKAETLVFTAGINPLQITAINTTGDFSETSDCGSTLFAGGTCSIQVTFTPTSQNAETGTLSVTSNEGTLTAVLSGKGIERAANAIYVPLDQSTIQAAIGAAVNGQTVYVLAGTYAEHINFQGKAITVASTDGPASTTIDGSLTGTVVTFSTGEGAGSVLSGFTITRGTSTFDGSGIFVNAASPTISGNIITANQGCEGIGIAVENGNPIISGNTISNNTQVTCSGGNGGGIFAGGGAPQILNNIITGNQLRLGGDGGGITLNGSSATISGNTIQHNSVFNNGGGISTFNSGSPSIVQNLITDNFTNSNGGGISIEVSSGSRGPFVVNNTIANNTASSGSAVYSEGFVASVQLFNNILVATPGAVALECNGSFNTTPPVLTANDAFSSGATRFAGTCAAAQGTNGNVSVDPQFVDSIGGNFHLQAASPVIDAGNNSAPNLPAVDLDGNPRIAFGSASTCSDTVDLGAYEFALTTTPAATLSPSALDFGTIALGTTSTPQTVTLTASQGCVAKASITISGDSDYQETDNCSSALGTGATCSIQLTFSPATSGTRTGSLVITSGNNSLSTSVTGQGGVAVATLTPTSLSFGNQLVNTTSAAQTVTVSNTGTEPLSISGISASGDFTQTNSCTANLAVGGTCTIQVAFAPKSLGTGSATLTITSNASNNPVSVALSGTGVNPPEASISPASLSFGSLLQGTESAPQTLTVSNIGGATLLINSQLVTGDGDFFVSNSSCVGGPGVAPGSSCSIQVVFFPHSRGPGSATLTISSNDPAAPQQSVSLTGSGIDYAIAAPASLSVRAGDKVQPTITISAVGGNFSNAVSLSCSGLPSGASCSFSPSSVVPGATSATSRLTINTQQSGGIKTPLGTYTIIVNGSSGSSVHSAPITLTVTK